MFIERLHSLMKVIDPSFCNGVDDNDADNDNDNVNNNNSKKKRNDDKKRTYDKDAELGRDVVDKKWNRELMAWSNL